MIDASLTGLFVTQLSELQIISKPSSGRSSYRNSNFDSIQKLVVAHQVILQAFQAYQNHMPTSIAMGVPDKLKELLNQSINLCDIHRNLINNDVATAGKREAMISVCFSYHKARLGFFCNDKLLDIRKPLQRSFRKN